MKGKAQDLKHIDSPHSCQIKTFIEVNRLHKTVLERRLNQTGVYRSQHQILMYISRNPNASQKDIALLHHASTATIAVSLKKLENGGYIRRVVNQEDNRYNQIVITSKGQEVVKQSRQYFQVVEDRMFAGLTPEELSMYQGCLERIRDNLKEFLLETEREDQKGNETI